MATRQLGPKRLARICGLSHTAIEHYQSGRSLPRLASGAKLAEALDDERLIAIVVRAHTRICPVDHVSFTYEGASNRLYCSEACSRVAAKVRESEDLALTRTIATRRLGRYAGAVDAFCRRCEPGGLCRDSSCELRAVSPLPLAHQAVARVSLSPDS